MTTAPVEPAIHDRGRGPEIVGTRITVFDIMDYLRLNWPPETIASWLRIPTPQVRKAIGYIDEHKEEVERDYQEILDRCARGNSPEIQAKLDALHNKWSPVFAEHKRRRQAQEHGQDHGRQ